MILNMKTNKLLELVTESQLRLAKKIEQREQGSLAIILWRLGFITTDQLASIF